MSPLVALMLLSLGFVAGVVAIDVVIESARTGATQLTILGNTLWQPPSSRIGILVLAGLGALVGIILALMAAAWRDHRLDRWFERERGTRSVQEAGSEARARLLEQRSGFLQEKVDKLTALREQLMRENDELRRESEELDARIVKAKRHVEQQEKVIVLPDLAGHPRTAGDGPDTAENENG